MRRGMVYSCGMFLIAFSLMSLGLAIRMPFAKNDPVPSMIQLERVKRAAEAAALSQSNVFFQTSATSFANSNDLFNVASSIPWDKTEYERLSTQLSKIAKLSNPPVDLDVLPFPQIITCDSLIWQRTASEDMIHLPNTTLSLTLRAHIMTNVSSCTISFSPGSMRMSVTVNGPDGQCIKTEFVEPSSKIELQFAGHDSLVIDNSIVTLPAPITYNLTVGYNDTRECPLILKGTSRSETSKAAAQADIYIKDGRGWGP